MTDPHESYFDPWDADDYDSADEAVSGITNDIVFRPPEPPPPPAAIAVWWTDRRNRLDASRPATPDRCRMKSPDAWQRCTCATSYDRTRTTAGRMKRCTT